MLVVDDDEPIRALLQAVLEREGHRIVAANEGRAAVRALFDMRPDAVVLDLDMPELDGWGALARIREVSDVPVLMLTASGDQVSKVRALRSGADDYLTKPFGVGELAARVSALLRRSAGRFGSRPAGDEDVHDDGTVRIDFRRASVTVEGRPLRLTPLEFRLLTVFVRHPGLVLSQEQLIQLVWSAQGYGTSEQVRVYVGYLRRKLQEVHADSVIETVRGFGYRYEPALVAAGSASGELAA